LGGVSLFWEWASYWLMPPIDVPIPYPGPVLWTIQRIALFSLLPALEIRELIGHYVGDVGVGSIRYHLLNSVFYALGFCTILSILWLVRFLFRSLMRHARSR
jgi:hypothetical protein